MFWGTTPALDLQEEYKTHCKIPNELNILLIGSSDARHIIKTMSKMYEHEDIKINFYVMDICMELTARQILFLNIALEPFEQMGLMQKIKTFMELYGNSLLRPAYAKFLTTKAKQLVNMITNLEYCYKVMGNINLDGLKYKERDYLEILFKYWSASDPFKICELWDRRVRGALGVRYDTKNGVFDWDLHMKMHENGAKQLCAQEYKHWRGTGVAFTWIESDVSKPNRTLATGVVPQGESFFHHGYLGDIVSGPFIAYGLDCKDKSMLKMVNHRNVHRATDITEYNLMHMFYELFHKKECTYKNTNPHQMGTIVLDLPNDRIVENGVNLNEIDFKRNSQQNVLNVENVSVNFVSMTTLDRLAYKEKYKRKFNIIYFSNLLIDKVDAEIINAIANSNCLLLIENQNYIPTNSAKQLDELATKITNKTSSIENVSALPFNPKVDSYAKFLID